MDKKSLRADALAARERVRPDAAKTASMELAKHLVELIPWDESAVAGYRAVRGEIDVYEALAQLSERGHTLSLPVVISPHAPLVFRRWRINHPLQEGKYGIEVPPESEPEVVPDIVIVPLVAFDSTLNRLGYGAGFYDATIHQLRQLKKQVKIIGVAFASQQIEHIPAEPHDAKLDAVVTEKGIILP
jgi:5-formyltetrahydrofolate cyclo-ligase